MPRGDPGSCLGRGELILHTANSVNQTHVPGPTQHSTELLTHHLEISGSRYLGAVYCSCQHKGSQHYCLAEDRKMFSNITSP